VKTEKTNKICKSRRAKNMTMLAYRILAVLAIL
jgi:hypothetical protein